MATEKLNSLFLVLLLKIQMKKRTDTETHSCGSPSTTSMRSARSRTKAGSGRPARNFTSAFFALLSSFFCFAVESAYPRLASPLPDPQEEGG